MQTLKIGIREFRQKLAGYLESGTPLAITRHGETLGFYIPARNVAARQSSKLCERPRRTWTR